MTLVMLTLFTISLLLVMVLLRMAKSTGLSVTHGELTGVNTVSSVFAVVLTTLLLNLIAHGQFLRTHGLKVLDIRQPKKKKTVSLTIRLFTHSHNPFTSPQTKLKISFLSQVVAVLRSHPSMAVTRRTQFMLGTYSRLQTSQPTLTGETSMVPTICPGQRTNTFLNIAVHAGLKVQPQPLLIDLTFWLALKVKPHSLQLHLMLKSLLTAKLEAPAMVVTPAKFINMLMMLVLFTHHASNIRVSTYNTNVVPLTFAVIAFGHHPDPMMMDYQAVSQ